MRFINSLAILSLAGLDLASPVSSPQDVSSLAGGTAVDTVSGALGLRDENHKRYAQRVRRQDNQDNEDVDSGDGIGAGIGASTLLRSRQLAIDAAEGDGVLLRGRHNSLDLGQLQENPGVTDGGAADGAAADSDATDSVAPEAGDASLRARGDGKPHSGEHGGQGQGKGKGKGKCNDARHTPCLHSEDVDTLVDAYVRMLSKWNDADAKYLADDLVDTSDSINILAGIPLGSATFPTKQAFIDHQHTQPDNLPLKVTHKSPYTCDEIALIWNATFGAAQKSVRGVTILGASKDSGDWQIKKIDVEFNSIAYLEDIGGSWSPPPQQ